MTPLYPLRVPLLGTTLIEASAGTGKTYTIATLFLRLLLERKLRVSEILVVTYTKAATAELRGRIRKRLTEAILAIDQGGSEDETLQGLLDTRTSHHATDRQRLIQAVRDFDEAAILTIHAFCQRILTECAFESRAPFESQLIESDQPLLQEVAFDYWARIAYDAPQELIEAITTHVGAAKLLSLAHRVVRDPNMPVLPLNLAPSPEAIERFRAARTLAKKLWAEAREAILVELSMKGRFDGGLYRAGHMRKAWAPALDALSDLQPDALPDWLPRLTPNELRKHTAKGQKPPAHPFFDAISQLVVAAEALDQHVLALRRDFVDYARREVGARHRELGSQSFDALLVKLRDALVAADGRALAMRVAKRYPAALIDEFQDTDPIQYAIFRHLYAAPSASLFLIGDPKQAIYGFRGADIFAYMQAARAADRTHTLNVNYRSDPRLLTALNTLYSRARRPFLFEELEFTPVQAKPDAQDHMNRRDPALQFLYLARSADTPGKKAINIGYAEPAVSKLVAYEIARLLHSPTMIGDRKVEPNDLAVLCRTNAQAAQTQSVLAALGIPTVRDGDSSVFDTDIARELAHVLAAVAEPADSYKIGAALASSILGVSGEELYQMRIDEAGLETWLDRFARLHQVWHERGFIQMLHQLMHEADVHARLLSRREGERRLTDLLHLSELLQRAVVEQHLGPLALLRFFAEMRKDSKVPGRLAAESAQLRLEHDEHAVMLTTVHRSKGLEYPIVFCPFMWTGPHGGKDLVAFHDANDDHRLKLDVGSSAQDAHRKAELHEELAESLRLLYVALTRAKHRCYVVWGRINQAEGSALGHLLHQGELPENDAQVHADLEALAIASGGSIGVRLLDSKRPPDRSRAAEVEQVLAPRKATRLLSGGARLSSFSRLTAERGQALSEPMADGQDRDDNSHVETPTETAEPAAQALVLLHDFPSGPRPGSLIHSVYEHIDFQRSELNELPAQTERCLTLYGLDAKRYGESLSAAIDQTLRTPLSADDPSLSLGSLARAQRVDELEFTLFTPGREGSLSPSRLAAVFEAHGAPAGAPDYPARLATLRALPGAGFLKGFIDLVFRHQERFYIVDYKSNWLGNTSAHYQQASLLGAMREHHYFLQYHLYSLALHRYLRVRVPDYTYARHFGGVYYLFVRGMAPEHESGTGVFFDRPNLLLIEALANALGAGDPASAGASAA